MCAITTPFLTCTPRCRPAGPRGHLGKSFRWVVGLITPLRGTREGALGSVNAEPRSHSSTSLPFFAPPPVPRSLDGPSGTRRTAPPALQPTCRHHRQRHAGASTAHPPRGLFLQHAPAQGESAFQALKVSVSLSTRVWPGLAAHPPLSALPPRVAARPHSQPLPFPCPPPAALGGWPPEPCTQRPPLPGPLRRSLPCTPPPHCPWHQRPQRRLVDQPGAWPLK